MKLNRVIYLVLVIIIQVFLLLNCRKEAINIPPPTVQTSPVTIITMTSANCGGEVISGTDVISCGVCWSTSQNPTIANSKTMDGTGVGVFTSYLTGLTANTTYYVRAYATNSKGTSYGNEVSLTTAGFSFTVTDIDGNVYGAIKIGTQVWMAENLKVTHYLNGDPIPDIIENEAWGSLATGGYCYYNNDPNNLATYGGLYNWYAAADGRNIAPMGWHVPTDAEWTALISFLTDKNAVWTGIGGKLKETGTAHWQSPNAGATNETGFNALPGGWRAIDYMNVSFMGFWWSSTEEYDKSFAYFRDLTANSNTVIGGPFVIYGGRCAKMYGLSVRCLKD